jgi:DNA-binding transcriptional LysR family regulator
MSWFSFPKGHHLSSKKPIAFADTLDEQWISLNPGAAMLSQQMAAAAALGKRIILRMKINSFDAVTQMVESGLGVALLPKTFAMSVLKANHLNWRPLRDFLILPQQNAKID